MYVCVSLCGRHGLIMPARSGALHGAILTLSPSLILASKVAKMAAYIMCQHTFSFHCF